MYRTPEEVESEDVRLWTETIYQSSSIFKGAPHEVKLGTDTVVGFQYTCRQHSKEVTLCHLVDEAGMV